MEDSVILVDENDSAYGHMPKYEAHQKGKLHRAFSIFIVNKTNELMLQKRADIKYHSGGLWTNTCCSHPKPGEDIDVAAGRRLMEEMGFDCHLKKQFSFIYKTAFKNGLMEYEYDHIFVGVYNKDPRPDPNEVSEWKWMSIDQVSEDLKINRDHYTEWFALIWEKTASTLRALDLSG